MKPRTPNREQAPELQARLGVPDPQAPEGLTLPGQADEAAKQALMTGQSAARSPLATRRQHRRPR